MDKPNINALFRAKVPGKLGETPIWFRALSEIQVQARDEYALLKMLERRKSIATPGYQANDLYVKAIADAPDESLIEALIAAETMDAQREAQSDVRPIFYPFPEDASDEEKADVMEKREGDAKRIRAEIDAIVAKRIESYRKSLEAISRGELVARTQKRQVDQQARLASLRAFQDYTVWASVYADEDCKRHLFDGPDMIGDLEPVVRAALISKYFNEVDTIQPIDLQYFFSTGDLKDSAPQSNPPTSESAAQSETTPTKSRGGGRKSS